MAIPNLLAELLLAPGASGYEDPVQAIVRREVEAIGAEISTDVLGTTIATVKGTTGGRTLGLFATPIRSGCRCATRASDGLLTVAQLASGTRATRAASACGSRRRPARSAGSSSRRTRASISWELLRVDIGATDREHALELVRPGDPIVLDGPPEALPNGRVLSGALDNRIGIYAGLEVLRRVAADPPEWDVALVVTVQEENNHGGARVTAQRLSPRTSRS